MLNRREAIQGLGFLGLGFLFRRRSPTPELPEFAPEPTYLGQLPSGVDIAVEPQWAFRPERLVIPDIVAPDFVIENIEIGGTSQFHKDGGPIPAMVFSPSALDNTMNMDMVGPGQHVKFRIRYVGDDLNGKPFYAALIGTTEGNRRAILPIASGCNVVT